MHLSKDGDKIKTALSIVVEGLATWAITPPHQNEVEKCKAFLGQAIDWCGKMPVQRVRDAALAVFRQLAGLLQPEQNAPLPFLLQAMHAMGPAMTISNDQMAVFVTIPKELALYWTPESLIQSLRDNGIEHGLQAQAITQLFEQRQFDQLVCVARGKDPIPGENARLQWLIDLTGHRTNSGGGIKPTDYKDVHYFVPVKASQPLLRKHPATTGEPGWDVFGQPIPPIPGIDLGIPQIENGNLSPDRLQVLSSVEGCAFLKNETVHVVPALRVNGNVDYESGNIKASVAVSVEEDVFSEFQIIAEGEIAVGGSVDAAFLQSGASIFCNKGVNGKEKAKLIAADDVYSLYINHASVKAGKTIQTSGSIIQSSLSAQRIRAEGKNGQIIGGTHRAWDDVCAYEIGSEAGVKTQLILGEELPKLQEMADKLTQAITAREQQIGKLEEIRKKLLPLTQKANADKTIATELATAQKKITLLKEEISTLRSKADQVQRDLSHSESSPRMVRARHALYPGTLIRILDKSLTVREPLGPTTILYSDGKLVTLPFQERHDHEQE